MKPSMKTVKSSFLYTLTDLIGLSYWEIQVKIIRKFIGNFNGRVILRSYHNLEWGQREKIILLLI